MKKELYFAPDTKVLELQVSSALLDASLLNNGGNAFGERYGLTRKVPGLTTQRFDRLCT